MNRVNMIELVLWLYSCLYWSFRLDDIGIWYYLDVKYCLV